MSRSSDWASIKSAVSTSLSGGVPPLHPHNKESETGDFADLEAALQTIVDEQVSAGFLGVVLKVDAPDIGFTWQGAGGMADAEVIEQLNGPDDELYGEMIAIRQQLNHTNTPQTPHFWKATALVP